MLFHLLPAEGSNAEMRALLQQMVNTSTAQGNLEAIKWCHSQIECPISVGGVDAAAMNGHFDVLRWNWENRPKMCPPLYELFKVAVIHCNVDTLRWMKTRRLQVDCRALIKESMELAHLNWDDAGALQVAPDGRHPQD